MTTPLVTITVDGQDLPTTLDGHQVAELLGCSYWSVLDQVKAETCPVMPLRLGKRLRWPTAAVLRALHLEDAIDAA